MDMNASEGAAPHSDTDCPEDDAIGTVREYPDDLMLRREVSYARVRREGGWRPRKVRDLWPFTDGGFLGERPLAGDWCIRGCIELRGEDARCELTVGPAAEPHFRFQVHFPADHVKDLEELVRSEALHRDREMAEGGLLGAPPRREPSPDGWSFAGECAEVLETPLPGGWCARLAVEPFGGEARAVLSVGPVDADHHAFIIPLPARSLGDVADLLEELRQGREASVERSLSQQAAHRLAETRK